MRRVIRSAAVQRKNFHLHVDVLKRAQRALRAPTEAETVERALAMVVFQEEAMTAFRNLCERGEVEDVFGHYRGTPSR